MRFCRKCSSVPVYHVGYSMLSVVMLVEMNVLVYLGNKIKYKVIFKYTRINISLLCLLKTSVSFFLTW